MTQKIVMLEINWKTMEARTVFYKGEDAFQRAEAVLKCKEESGGPDWSRSLLFGPMEVGDEQA